MFHQVFIRNGGVSTIPASPPPWHNLGGRRFWLTIGEMLP